MLYIYICNNILKELHKRKFTDLAFDYFKSCVLPVVYENWRDIQFESKLHWSDVKNGDIALSQIYNPGGYRALLNCLVIFPEFKSPVIDIFIAAMLKMPNDDYGYFFKICEHELEFNLTKQFPKLRVLFEARENWLQEKLKVKPILCLSMPDVKLNGYPEIEKFMHSEKAAMKYRFNNHQDLKMFLYEIGQFQFRNRRGELVKLTKCKRLHLIQKRTVSYDEKLDKYNGFVNDLEKIREMMSTLWSTNL